MSDSLFECSPTEELVLEVLAARYRLGEQLWTFRTRYGTALRSLQDKGLIEVMHGITDGTVRALLTDKGREAILSPTYGPPEKTGGEYQIALRHDDMGLDDVVVKNVEMFRMERMDTDYVWLACYLTDGQEIVFDLWRDKKTIRYQAREPRPNVVYEATSESNRGRRAHA